MGDHGVRLSGAMALLALLWVGVYWWWEPMRARPAISVDAEPAPEPSAIRDPLGPPDPEARPATLPPPVSEPRAAAIDSLALEPPVFRTYVVRPGDTFERIARRELGAARFAGAIARANAFVDPRRLRPGREIRIPADPANVQGRATDDHGEIPPPMAPVEYIVQRHDTLSGIASRVYGSPRFADDLFQANRAVLGSPDNLRIGQRLELPPLAEAPINPVSATNGS